MPNRITLNLVRVKELLTSGKSITEMAEILNVSKEKIRSTLRENHFPPPKQKVVRWNDEQKKHFSETRKLYLKNNPDKHPWRSNNKFKSKPCEKLKEWLAGKDIPFISEYSNHGVDGRFYSIDIALPDKKIALEVNGNQHYNRDGTLKPYYDEREILLESEGWRVYQLHYSICYKISKMENILLDLINSPIKADFDYTSYVKFRKTYNCSTCGVEIKNRSIRCKTCKEKLKTVKIKTPIDEVKVISKKLNSNYCVDCSVEIGKTSIRCDSCYHVNKRRAVRPTKEVIHNLVWSYPMTHLSKMFNVSDNSIRSWCESYNLLFPNNKFWGNLKAGNIIDYQI